MTTPRVSIVLPTRNGIATLASVLDAIARQHFDGGVEVVAVDSASDDGSAELLRARATRFIAIAPGTFNHGLTRNQGIEAARGEFVVVLSQDARPADADWLGRLVEPLERRPQVAGTFARQTPADDAGAITRYYLARWAASSREHRTARIEDAAAFAALAPIEQMQRCAFDNVCSCIRRSVWERHPFRQTTIAEDLEWAKEVLLAGYELEYVPDAVVQHSHDRSPTYEFERTALLHQRLFELFAVRTVPTFLALVRAVVGTTALHMRVRSSANGVDREGHADSVLRALALAVAWPAGQYIGGRRAASGRPPVASGRV